MLAKSKLNSIETKISESLINNEINHEAESDKACFQHGMAYGDFKDFARRTASDKVLRDKAFNIAKNPEYDGCQRGLASMICKCFPKKTSGSGVKSMSNEQLAEELHKPIIRKFF